MLRQLDHLARGVDRQGRPLIPCSWGQRQATYHSSYHVCTIRLRCRLLAVDLCQLGYSQEAGGQLPCRNPKSLLSAKYAKGGPCGLAIKHINRNCQKNLGWLSKVVNNQKNDKHFERLPYHQGGEPRRAPLGGVKHKNNAKASLGTLVYNCNYLCYPIHCHFNLKQYIYIS